MFTVEISNKQKLNNIITIFKNLNKITEHVNVNFTASHMYIQGKCSINICIVELNLLNSWFDKYDINEDTTIGVNCEVLFKVMSCISDNQTLVISHQGDDTFNIEFKGQNTIEKKFELQMVELDEELLEIPYKEHEVDIKITSSIFSDLINQIKMFGEEITISCTDENVNLKTTSVSGTSNIILNEDNLIEYGIEEDLKLVSMFGISYLHVISTFSKLSSETNIHISQNFPLEVRYPIEGSWMDDSDNEDNEDTNDFNDKNMIRFFLAPKIDDQ